MHALPRWQDLPATALEAIYNPSAAGPDVEAGRARRLSESAQAREHLRQSSRSSADLRYGHGSEERFDLYRPIAPTNLPAPLVLFIHGGYWRAGDKHDSTLVVPPLLNAGAVVANINYDLCPSITLDTMVAQIIRATRFCHQHAGGWQADPERLTLIGHSAGAHLAARVMNEKADTHGLAADLVSAVIAISGIYEPEVITQITVNDEAQIDVNTARRNDCLTNPPQGRADYLIVAGGNEPAGWIEQSRLYAETVNAAGYNNEFYVVNDTDHFTVSCEAFIEGSQTFAKIKNLVAA